MTKISPNHREGITAISTITGSDEYVTSTNGALNTTGGGGGSGGTSSNFDDPFPTVGTAIGGFDGTNMVPLSIDNSGNLNININGATQTIPVNITQVDVGTFPVTDAAITDGSQLSQVVDGSGNVVGVTANALDVNIKSGGTVTQGAPASIAAGWPIIGGELADTTGTFTNATQSTSITTSNFDGYSTVIVSINGTYGTATGVFELSDDSGTTWYAVNAARSDGTGVETGYTALTNTNRMWTLSVSGADALRVRSTAVASGTANIRISVESMPTPEAATVNAFTTNGVATADVTANDTGFNGQPVNNATKTITFTTSSSGVQQLLADTDMRGYSSITVNLTSVGSGLAWTGQFAPNTGGTYNNATTWVNTNALGSIGALGVTVNISYASRIVNNFFRLNISALASGTVSGYVTLSTMPLPYYVAGTSQLGTWTVGVTGYPVAAAAADTFSNPTVTQIGAINQVFNGTNWDRQRSGGVTGMAGVTVQASPSGGWSFTNISTSTTTTVKSGAGTLHLVTVNTLGTVASSATIYDNTAGSGTIIAIINTLSLSGSFTYDIAFATGCTVVTTGTSAPNITVAYK